MSKKDITCSGCDNAVKVNVVLSSCKLYDDEEDINDIGCIHYNERSIGIMLLKSDPNASSEPFYSLVSEDVQGEALAVKGRLLNKDELSEVCRRVSDAINWSEITQDVIMSYVD